MRWPNLVGKRAKQQREQGERRVEEQRNSTTKAKVVGKKKQFCRPDSLRMLCVFGGEGQEVPDLIYTFAHWLTSMCVRMEWRLPLYPFPSRVIFPLCI